MKYRNIIKATFIERPNRFIARVKLSNNIIETVHVKNTGRCKELLIPGCDVYLEKSDNPSRKTKFDLVAVIKNNGMLINIDSQAPNVVMKEWLYEQNYSFIKSEYVYNNSRIDFYLEDGISKFLLEVKGCTLEKDGIGYFPDAPTIRGVKHLQELTAAIKLGFKTIIAFVIQMDHINEVRPNVETHPEFGIALEKAKSAGVEVWFMTCHVDPDGLVINSKIV